MGIAVIFGRVYSNCPYREWLLRMAASKSAVQFVTNPAV